ncbi:MAG: phosphatase PAP2 family protein [Candidatus Parvarchaeota archaeon]|jgi:membrane-associated phospholipid phosphatase|nr:phosphatase PAP2 family protein [Candidatus Parvarchaeota archaeon]MCL5107103.1 phosphatase PAP2 family protein [Candidatus Parvarchaeota archaeon]
MRNNDYFGRFSILVENYPIEIFTFEMLIGIILDPSLKMAVLLFSGVTATAVFSEGLKLVFREKRPEEALRRNFYKRTFRLNRRSFPSSHSAIAAFFFTAFYNTALFWPFLIFGILVMYSRLYIKSHYKKDVIAGAIIGILTGIAFLWVTAHLRI